MIAIPKRAVHGQGSFDRITRGSKTYERFRITIQGKVHEITGRSKEALAEKVMTLRLSAQRANDATLPSVSTDGKGRQWVRIADPGFRDWLYRRDHGVCGICRKPVAPGQFHVDHIRPVSEGGNHHVDNLRISHPVCNIKRAVLRQRAVRFDPIPPRAARNRTKNEAVEEPVVEQPAAIDAVTRFLRLS